MAEEWREELAKLAESAGVQFDVNSGFGTLGDIAKAQPELADKVLQVVGKALQNDRNTGYSLVAAYETLRDIAKVQPELADKVLQNCDKILHTIDKAMQNDTCKSDFLQYTYTVLDAMVYDRPELTDKVFQVFDRAVQHGGNDGYALDGVYEKLGYMASERPELADRVFQIYDKAVQNNRNGYVSLQKAYFELNSIAEARPELTDKVLQVFDRAVQTKRNGYSSLDMAYSELGDIAKAQPELADKVLQVVEKAVQNDRNDEDSLSAAYKLIHNITNEHPELTGDAVKIVFNLLPKSMKDEQVSGKYDYMNELLTEKVSNYDEEVLDPRKYAAYFSDEEEDETEDELAAARQEKENAIRGYEETKRKWGEERKSSEQKRLESVSADLARDVFKLFYVDKFDAICDEGTPRLELMNKLVQVPGAVPKMAETFIKEGNSENPGALAILMQFQKKARSDIFVNLPPKWNTVSKALTNLRFSTEKEIDFVHSWSVKKISEYSFSAQQRTMNVLVSELGKENNLPPEELKRFRKSKNAEVGEMFANNSDWLVPASFKAADVFGCWFPNYLKKAQKAGLSTHDAVYWLPEDMGKAKNESFSQFIRNNILYSTNDGKEHARPLDQLSVIARNWEALTPEQEKMRYRDVLAVCLSKKYDNHKYENFAVEAAKFGYCEEDYYNMEQIYQAGLNVPEPFDSGKRFEFTSEGGTAYVGRFLPRDDPRVGFFGNYTDCCQHYGGVGDTCAVSSVKDPYSQLFVIENNEGRIIAGSWVWENTDGKYRDVCFDNIEAIGEYANHPVINKIYEKVGDYLVKEAECRYVTIGRGYQDADTSAYQPAEKPIPRPKQYDNGYSDALLQVVLKHNPEAKPLDKSKESQRFIRDVCFLDETAMDKISASCFPESDGRLQQPENLAGKVLVDKNKGVVGYCLWDEQEKSVYDMAVLPEYRKDKNASSAKLFLEAQKEIRKIGGEWTAELRDKTTYRYMKTMQLRGMVKMDTLNVDHEMSDGSKVFSVRFTPLKPNRSKSRENENVAEEQCTVKEAPRHEEASGRYDRAASQLQSAVVAARGQHIR